MTAVVFLISQIGDDAAARRFMASLQNDEVLRTMIHCTSSKCRRRGGLVTGMDPLTLGSVPGFHISQPQGQREGVGGLGKSITPRAAVGIRDCR